MHYPVQQIALSQNLYCCVATLIVLSIAALPEHETCNESHARTEYMCATDWVWHACLFDKAALHQLAPSPLQVVKCLRRRCANGSRRKAARS